MTSIERTLMDLASRLDERQLEHALVAADRSRRLNWRELQRIIEQGNGRKGLRCLRRVAASVDPRASETVSPLEVDFLALCQRSNLPLPQVNVVVEGRIVDFYWPKEKVIVETDGYAYHSDRPAFEKDHESTVSLTVAGYRVHRATYRMLKSKPDLLLSLLRSEIRR